MEPSSFLFFSDSESKLGSEVYHSLLVGGSVGVMSEYRGWKAFLGPVISGYKVVVDEISRCSGVQERSGVGDLS